MPCRGFPAIRVWWRPRMALLWTWRPRGASYELLRQIGVKSTEGNFGHKETLTLSAGRGE